MYTTFGPLFEKKHVYDFRGVGFSGHLDLEGVTRPFRRPCPGARWRLEPPFRQAVEGRYEHLKLQVDRYRASYKCHANKARDHDGPDRRAVEVRRRSRSRARGRRPWSANAPECVPAILDIVNGLATLNEVVDIVRIRVVCCRCETDRNRIGQRLCSKTAGGESSRSSRAALTGTGRRGRTTRCAPHRSSSPSGTLSPP